VKIPSLLGVSVFLLLTSFAGMVTPTKAEVKMKVLKDFIPSKFAVAWFKSLIA
jgi:hypothetical protein